MDASSPHDSREISRLVVRLAEGSPSERHEVLQRLVPLVYAELRELARSRRASWRGVDDPGTTSLVHEAYARLAVQKDPRFRDPRQFFAVASKAMRSILVDNARKHSRLKRGGTARSVPLEEATLVSAARSAELLALDEALERLEEAHAGLARVVELRCFGGLTVEESTEILDVSPATVKRRWSLARAWLHRELTGGRSGEAPPE